MIDTQKAAAPTDRPPYNRRRLRSHLINNDVRLRLVLDDVLFALAAALTAIGVLYYLSNREIGDSMWSAHISIKQTRELLTNGVKVAGIVTFVAVLVFGLWSLMDAHRIAGPMHRLHRLLNEIADGNLAHEIRFRRRDEFSELAAAADRLVDTFAERLEAVREQAETLELSLRNSDLSIAQVEGLRAQALELNKSLEFFRVPGRDALPTVDDTPLA